MVRRSLTLALLIVLGCPVASFAAPIRGEVGIASYYGSEFHDQATASGERFDMREMTAAHRTLPFGTRVRVTNLGNGRAAVVRINDRGPFVQGRVLDLSYAAARELRLIGSGMGRVRLQVLPRSDRGVTRLATSRSSIMRRLWRPQTTAPWEPVAARADEIGFASAMSRTRALASGQPRA